MITILRQRRFHMYKSIDLFAGIGGIRKGFDRAFGKEINTVFVSEWDEFAQKTYRMKYKDDFDIVTELIEVLDDSYRSITDKSKKAAIENNRMNEMFLERLKTIGYISSYREDDDKLRLSHKRNH